MTFNLIKASLFFVAMLILQTSIVAAAKDTAKDEMGLTQLKIIQPASKSVIKDTMPIIGADASGLEIPIDTQTVVITMNGADVSDDAEITPGYILYQPLEPLPPGTYEIRITGKNTSKKDIEPLTWTFRIEGESPVVAVEEKSDRTTGKLSISNDYVTADYNEQTVFDVSTFFREKEGSKVNADFSFANVSEGRTIIGAFHRETQAYTDIELDKGRLDYVDSNFNASLGHFWFTMSDLTVTGTELDGARIGKDIGRWNMTLFSGRTQDPSTSGTFKQKSSGLRSGYNWSNRHKTTVTGLVAYETGDDSTSATPTARDEIISLMHEFKYDDSIKAALEFASDKRRMRGESATRDEAVQFTLKGNRGPLSGSLKAYSIQEDFFPVAEGSTKYLNNDREGFHGMGVWQTTDFLSIGGGYEQYDTDSTDVRTKRGNAFVAVSTGVLQSLKYQKTKLVTAGTESETDSVTGVLLFPSTRNIAETRLTAGWQNIGFDGSGVQTDTDVYLISISSSYRDRLGLAVSYSRSDTTNLTLVEDTENENFSVGLNWNVIPFKLLWNFRYENVDSTGTNNTGGITVSNEENRFKTSIKYHIDDIYTLNLGYDYIDYEDTISPVYNYDQNIVRTGMEMNF